MPEDGDVRAAILSQKLANFPPSKRSACPHNWFSFHEFCFSVWAPNLPWDEAKKVCQAVDGNLASILSEDENAFVLMLLTGDHFWIGASNVNFDRQWRWTDGSLWKQSQGGKNPLFEGPI